MNKIFLFLLTLIFPLCSFGQVFTENFNDGSISDGPIWSGDVTDFDISSMELVLNAPGVADTTVLSTPVSIVDSTVWTFKVRLDGFSPTNSNTTRIFLSSDVEDLKAPKNGYYLRLGENGSDDAVNLYKQTGTNLELLVNGTLGTVAATPVTVYIRITRDANSFWTLETDYVDGSNYTTEFAFQETGTPHMTGNYFGFFCKYSASNTGEFAFDNVMISPVFVDDTPPAVTAFTITSPNTAEVQFSEAVALPSAENPLNYVWTNGFTTNTATRDLVDNRLVQLSINESFISGNSYTLKVSNVEDENGNAIPSGLPESATATFLQVNQPLSGEILINEIMADPNPAPVGWPAVEYVEFYNTTSNKTFDLDGMEFDNEILPTYLLGPGEYVVVHTNTVNFSGVPELLMGGFPALTNGGEELKLLDVSKNLIDVVDYDDAWYNDPIKDDGGWSLERINPNPTCDPATNWSASNDPSGGTPGQINSIFSNTVDNAAPLVFDAQAISDQAVLLSFDEALDETTASNVLNYEFNNGLGVPDTARLENPSTILLIFDMPIFLDGESYIITINNVEDCGWGNAIAVNTQVTFGYTELFSPNRYEILINEIMADPNPKPLGLPEIEYIELYNTSANKAFNLEGMSLMGEVLPSFVLLPNTYLVIHPLGAEFQGVASLPFADFDGISNGGELVDLVDPEGNIIDAVDFDASWYLDSGKDDGGWSVERINPNRPCEQAANWRASVDINGGTPGAANSVLETTEDEELPDLVKVYPDSTDRVLAYFSEAMDEATASNPMNYTIDQGIGNPSSAVLLAPLFQSVLLTFDTPLEEGIRYTLTVNAVNDCVQNPLGMFNTLPIALPEEPVANDLIINEVLYNPVTGGSDFVEIFNRSNKVVDLGNVYFANRNDDRELTEAKQITERCLLFPDEYVAITENPTQVLDQYDTPNPKGVLYSDLPSYNDDEGDVILLYNSLILDEFGYSDDYEFALLDDDDGVSLERIDAEASTQEASNWHSAAEAVGFATPAYRNSQDGNLVSDDGNTITIDNNVLSPDQDGYQDFLIINYQLDQPGFVANVSIYDAKGRLVKTLIKNELLGPEGQFKWDGDTDFGTKARLGVYVVFTEVFGADGKISRFKNSCVVAGG